MKPLTTLLMCLVALTGCATSPQDITPGASGQSFADVTLTRDAFAIIKLFENAHRVSGTPKLVVKRVTQAPNAKGAWAEEWIIQRPDVQVAYDVKFIPSPGGGTDIAVSNQPRRI